MSVTISNCNEICGSPTNSSKAKMLYTFSKSSRFPKRRRILCDKFYEHSSSVSPARTTTLGFGNKYEFTKEAPNTPPPNTYHLKTDFDRSVGGRKGFGFGEGRSQMEATGPLVVTVRNKNPGPGAYRLPSTLSKSNFTIGARNGTNDKEKKQAPGPGAYPVTFCINQSGSYFLAKYRNSGARNFSRLPSRASTAEKVVPGPGAYDISNELMSPDGNYITSKMHNSLVRRFGTSIRSHLNRKNENPGPGNYKLPSQFGHYISKDAVKGSADRSSAKGNSRSLEKENKGNA